MARIEESNTFLAGELSRNTLGTWDVWIWFDRIGHARSRSGS